MLIKIKVFPNAKEEEVIKKSEDSFEIYVKAKPIMGLANKAVARLLSLHFEISESKIKLIKGFRERNKIFEINN